MSFFYGCDRSCVPRGNAASGALRRDRDAERLGMDFHRDRGNLGLELMSNLGSTVNEYIAAEKDK